VYSQISNASLIDYKKKLQSQISSIKAADIFDTSTRYTVLNEPTSLLSSIITRKSSPSCKKSKGHDEYSSTCERGNRSRMRFRSEESKKTPGFLKKDQFSRVRSILQRKKIRKKLRQKRKNGINTKDFTSKNKYLNLKASKGFSNIRFKIDREKNPKLHTKFFPELERLKKAARINLKKFDHLRDTSHWAIKNMEMNKSAYHYFNYQINHKTLKPEPFPEDGKRLEQLKILDHAPKPTLYSEGTRLTTYLKKMHEKLVDVNIQYEFNLHLKHKDCDIKTYKEHLDSLTRSLAYLKAHPAPLNIKTCNLAVLYSDPSKSHLLDRSKYY